MEKNNKNKKKNKNKNMKNIFVLVLMIVAIIALSGCTGRPPEKITPTPGVTGNTPVETTEKPIETITPPVESKGIMFSSVDKGSLNTAEIDKPTIFIAGSIADAKKFTDWDTNLANKIKNINFDEQLVIAVFRGMMNTSGYEITVRDINQMEGRVKITVNIAGPIEAANPVITYPYHAIAIKKDQLTIAPETSWEVYTEDGQLLAQTKYP